MGGNKKGITPCKKRWTTLVIEDKEDGLCRPARSFSFFMKKKGKRNDHREVKMGGADEAERKENA
jgi:hypothetical protein